MNKKIIFFDGDGTLWYPHATKRSKEPWWLYADEQLKDHYLEHLTLTPHATKTLKALRSNGIKTIILSTHPHEAKEATRILTEKVSHFNLHDYFDEFYATADYPESKAEKILETLKRLDLEKEDALMVGDSYKHDYYPVQERGIDALLINSGYHLKNKDKEPAKLIIDDLDELIPLLNLN